MQTFETAAVISLIDHLSGPLASLSGKVAAAENTMSKRVAAVATAGQHLTYQLTLPMALAAHEMTKTALELSKNENTISGILLGRAHTMGLSSEATKTYVAEQQKLVDRLGEQAYKASGGRMKMVEYGATVAQAVKAGHDAEAAAAVSVNAFQLALAGRIDQHEAAEHILNTAQAFGFTSQKVDEFGNVVNRTFAEVNPEIQRYTDLMSIMSSNANMTVGQAADALKLPAPIAHMMGINPEFIGVMVEAMAEKGVKGSEAAVNLRSFLGAIFAPKSTAVSGLAQGGVDFNKFRTGEGITPEGFREYARLKNYTITSEQAKAAFDKATTNGSLDLTALGVGLGESLKHTGKKGTPVGPGTANKAANEYISQHAKDIDVIGLVLAMRKEMAEKHLQGSQLSAFMEKRQIPRTLAYLSGADDAGIDVFANSARRMFGEDWKNVLDKYVEMHKKSAKAAEKYLTSVAEKATKENARIRAEEHARGLEGGFQRIEASYNHLIDSLYKVGAFDNVTHMLDSISGAMDRLSQADPANLTHLVDTLTFLAAAGPLMLLGGRIGGVIGAMTQFGKALWGLEGALGAAKLATEADALATSAGGAAKKIGPLTAALLGFGTAAIVVGGMLWLVNEMLHPDAIKKGIAHHGKPDPGTESNPGDLLPGVDKDAWDKWEPKLSQDQEPIDRKVHRTLNRIRAWSPTLTGGPQYDLYDAKGLPTFARQPGFDGGGSLTAELASLRNTPVTVQGDVKGAVDVHSTMTVSPSPWFVTKIEMLEHVSAEVSGKLASLGQTMAGSNATKGAK